MSETLLTSFNPIIDLHCHLDGALRPTTIHELALEKGLIDRDVNVDDTSMRMRVPADNPDLRSYLQTFAFPLACLQTEAALRRVAYEFVLDRAEEGLAYVEVRFAPSLHTEEGLSPDEIVSAVLAGLAEGDAKTGIDSRLILCAMRDQAPGRALETAELVKAFKGQGVVAFDLAGNEKPYPPALFSEAFAYCRLNNLPFTIHAGEGAGPESIRQAVELGASRIGHGVRIGEDKDLMRLVAAQKIGLEMCPTSNIQTGVVASYAEFPIFDYLEEGIVATICTDNPTVSGTTLAAEYSHLILAHAPSDRELALLLGNAQDMAFDSETFK